MKKILLIAIPVIILASVAAFLYFKNIKDNGDNGDDDSMTNENTSIVNESEPETAQENFTDGDEREPGNSLVEEEGSGYIEDTSNSSNSSTTDSAEWTVSSDGNITVFSPVDGQKLTNGSVLSGQTSYSNINFRLIDNVSGVISEGSLSVIDGKYSGVFSFSTTATEGRLDIFYQNADGTEKSNTNIPIEF